MQTRYELHERGADLAIEVAGASAAECLAAAVAAFAVAVTGADQPPAPRTREPLDLDDRTPEGLLVRLVDDLVARLDADGLLGVALDGATVAEEVDGMRLRGDLALTGLAPARAAAARGAMPAARGVTPKAATWHGARLEPAAGGGWRGEVTVDL